MQIVAQRKKGYDKLSIMAFLFSPKFRKIVLVVILIAASILFWMLNPHLYISIFAEILAAVALISIISEKNIHFIVVFLSFISSYVLYNYMLVNNLPAWLIMISILIIFLYIFGYLEKVINFPEGINFIFLLVFSLATLETFLFLGYFLISPLNRSLLLAMTVYIIYGFCDNVIEKQKPKQLITFIVVFLVVFVTMLVTASWGQV